MHKKLEAELISLAHSILQLKNKDDVNVLHQKAAALHEKLSILKFVNYYVDTTPENEQTKEDLTEKITRVWEKNEENELAAVEEEVAESILDTSSDHLHDENKHVQIGLFEEEEEKVTEVNIDKTSFQKEATEVNTSNDSIEKEEIFASEPIQANEIKEPDNEIHPLSSDTKNTVLITIPLSDRITIVNDLFEGSLDDFSRVLSQLNSFDTEKEALNFIKKIVKSDYNWEPFAETEDKFMHYIHQKF